MPGRVFFFDLQPAYHSAMAASWVFVVTLASGSAKAKVVCAHQQYVAGEVKQRSGQSRSMGSVKH